MAGGMGRPGANIGAGLPQAGGQPQANAPIPTFNAPAISPMQQYLQSLGINRMGYNPQATAGMPSYAGPRPVPTFAPRIMPSQPAPQAAPQQPTNNPAGSYQEYPGGSSWSAK